MTDTILSSRDGAVLTLTINRPDALNALNPPTMQALRTGIEAAGRESAIGAVILTGAGRAFCAGADLKDVSARLDAGDTDVGRDLRENYVPRPRGTASSPSLGFRAWNGLPPAPARALRWACALRSPPAARRWS